MSSDHDHATTPSPVRCAACGADGDILSLAGLCPACLLGAGVMSSLAAPTLPAAGPVPVDEGRLALEFPELEVVGLIGRGGMGTVFKVRQKRLDRVVALKLLPEAWSDDPCFRQRFAREAKALAALDHPNIVTIHDFGERGNLFYFTMEWVAGGDLAALADAGVIPPARAVDMLAQVCAGLQFAHDRGFIHREHQTGEHPRRPGGGRQDRRLRTGQAPRGDRRRAPGHRRRGRRRTHTRHWARHRLGNTAIHGP